VWGLSTPGSPITELSGRLHARSISAGGDHLSSPVALIFNPILAFNGGLGVSMLVHFGASASDIVFRGATVTVEVP
jgi:hypothetical protein